MSDLVDADEIEQIVGIERHPTRHFGRAVSAEQVFYILHSQACKDSTPDLRECAFSLALDMGIDPEEWTEDEPVALDVEANRLVPVVWSRAAAEDES